MRMTEKLIALRKQKGITQNELAELLDVSRQAVSRWEAGSSVPGIDNLRVLSGLYGVSIDYLLDDSAEEPTASPAEEQRQPDAQDGIKSWNRHICFVICVAVVLTLTVFFIGFLFGSSQGTEQNPNRILTVEDMMVEDNDDGLPVVTFSLDSLE